MTKQPTIEFDPEEFRFLTARDEPAASSFYIAQVLGVQHGRMLDRLREAQQQMQQAIVLVEIDGRAYVTAEGVLFCVPASWSPKRRVTCVTPAFRVRDEALKGVRIDPGRYLAHIEGECRSNPEFAANLARAKSNPVVLALIANWHAIYSMDRARLPEETQALLDDEVAATAVAEHIAREGLAVMHREHLNREIIGAPDGGRWQ